MPEREFQSLWAKLKARGIDRGVYDEILGEGEALLARTERGPDEEWEADQADYVRARKLLREGELVAAFLACEACLEDDPRHLGALRLERRIVRRLPSRPAAPSGAGG